MAPEHGRGYFTDPRRGVRAVCRCGWSGPWRPNIDTLPADQCPHEPFGVRLMRESIEAHRADTEAQR